MNAGRAGVGLFWITFAILIAAVLWVLLAACGLTWPGGAPMLLFCPLDARADPALAAEQERQRALQRRVRDLEIALLDRPYCPPPQPQAQLEPEPIPAPEPEPAPPEQERAEPLAPCPERRPVEVVLVLDASNSMGWDFEADPDALRQLKAAYARYNQLASRIENAMRPGNFRGMFGAPALIAELGDVEREIEMLERRADLPDRLNRIDVAKRSLTAVVETSPSDVDFAFVTFNTCGQPHPQGRYAPSQRPSLIGRIERTALGSNTALADTIAALPALIHGGQNAEQPVNVVLVSDGEDSCGGDPCAAAAALKRSLPYAYVNVIGISDEASAARCVPETTAGLFVAAADAEALAEQLVQAAGQDLPEHCR